MGCNIIIRLNRKKGAIAISSVTTRSIFGRRLSYLGAERLVAIWQKTDFEKTQFFPFFCRQDTSDRKANRGRRASVKMGTSYATYFITSSPSCGRFKNSGHVLKKYGILIKKKERRKALKILKYIHIEKNKLKGKYKKKR